MGDAPGHCSPTDHPAGDVHGRQHQHDRARPGPSQVLQHQQDVAQREQQHSQHGG